MSASIRHVKNTQLQPINEEINKKGKFHRVNRVKESLLLRIFSGFMLSNRINVII